jgi:hypothetical protein
MCLNTVITDVIWHQSACSALFFLLVLLINLLLSNADLHISPVTKHCPITTPGSYTTACLFTAPVAVRLMSVLTWSDTLFCQAAAGRQSALWQWHELLSPYVWNTVQTQTQQSSTELLDTGVIRTKFHSLLCTSNSDSRTVQIRRQYLSGSDVKYMFRSDTSICPAVMLSTCSDQTPVSDRQWC